MNKQKEKEMLEDLAFIKQQFSQRKPEVTLPQSLQGEQLRRRLEHTRAVPKPALRPLYWRLAPMACVSALVLGVSAYSVSSGGWTKNAAIEYQMMDMAEDTTAEDALEQPPLMAEAAPRIAMAPAGANDECAPQAAAEEEVEEVLDGGAGEQPFQFSISQEQGADASVATQRKRTPNVAGYNAAESENANGFSDYDQLHKALDEMQREEKSGVHFGQTDEYQPELYGRGETLDYASHSLYIGVNPATGEEADILYVTGKDRQTVEKEIQLPPQYMAEVFLGKEGEAVFAVAAQEEYASMMVMSLETYQGASYSQPGRYRQCYVQEGVLFVVTSMEVDQQALEEGEYIPYLITDGEKQLLSLEQIYHTGGSKPWYTVISRLSLNRQQPGLAVAVLGGEARVSLTEKELTVEDKEGERLVLSPESLTPVSQ